MREFYIFVKDHTSATYSIEGPMSDDTPWVKACFAAQGAGRDVTITTSDLIEKENDKVAMSEMGFTEVGRGTILQP